MFKLHILVIFCIQTVINEDYIAPKVKIKQGLLRGTFMTSDNGKQFSAFMGIPYAQPPVGNLRFKASAPANPWKGTLDASKVHHICPQVFKRGSVKNISIQGDEDCLYINVYTPQVSASDRKSLPVMFFIHGGGFMTGSGNIVWYGPELLLNKDVVLVSPNYRLNVLGFLSAGNHILPGNNGLKDQNLALKWVRDNIAAFGGDPNSITVFGQSMGGASAHYHAISPLSRDLIKSVIAQSGTALAVWALTPIEDAIRTFEKLASNLNCSIHPTENAIQCLQNVSLEDLFTRFIIQEQGLFGLPVIEPETEEAFLSKHPKDLLKSGNVPNIPFMTGIVKDEGEILMEGIYDESQNLKNFFNRVVSFFPHNKDLISGNIQKFYFGGKGIVNATKSEVSNLYADAYYLNSVDETIKIQKFHADQPIYYYLFSYNGSVSEARPFNRSKENVVYHGDDLAYLFTSSSGEFPNYKLNTSDRLMSELMTTLWVNFATTGNPTPSTDSSISTKWQPVQSDHFEYYHIKNATNVKMAQGLFANRTNFWRKLWDLGNVHDEL